MKINKRKRRLEVAAKALENQILAVKAGKRMPKRYSRGGVSHLTAEDKETIVSQLKGELSRVEERIKSVT